MESAVKVVWHKDDLWSAQLLTVDDDGFDTLDLSPGTHMNFELTDERRCVGYFSGVSEREPCPSYRRIDTGSQCAECRRKDVYAGYVEGREGAKVDADFSVYLAQCGTEIKVGVTRTEKVERRWVEQGADYAAEIARGLTSEEALRMEDAVSQRGIKQRIRKEAKVGEAQDDQLLRSVLEELGYSTEAEVRALTDSTVYPPARGELVRRGRFSGEVESVKGQIISNGRLCMAITAGKVMREPSQTGLGDY